MKETFMPHEAILLCGGKGLRMGSSTERTITKSLLKVGGKELIQYSLDNLPPNLVSKLVVATQSIGNTMYNWFQSSTLPYNKIVYSCQGDIPLIERISSASVLLDDDCFIVCNTDEIRRGLDLSKIVESHRKFNGLATLVVGYSDHLSEQRVVSIGEDGRVVSTRKTPEEYVTKPEVKGLVNTGLIIMQKRALEGTVNSQESGWSCFLDPLSDAGKLFAYVDPKIIYFNINTLSQLKRANDFIAQDHSV